MKVKSLSHVQLFAMPWTIAHQVSLSMGFPRQENWSGLPFPSPGDLTDPGIKPDLHCRRIFYLLSHQGSPFFFYDSRNKEFEKHECCSFSQLAVNIIYETQNIEYTFELFAFEFYKTSLLISLGAYPVAQQ